MRNTQDKEQPLESGHPRKYHALGSYWYTNLFTRTSLNELGFTSIVFDKTENDIYSMHRLAPAPAIKDL